MWLTAEPASDSEMPMQNSPSPAAAIGSQRFLQRVVAEVLDRAWAAR